MLRRSVVEVCLKTMRCPCALCDGKRFRAARVARIVKAYSTDAFAKPSLTGRLGSCQHLYRTVPPEVTTSTGEDYRYNHRFTREGNKSMAPATIISVLGSHNEQPLPKNVTSKHKTLTCTVRAPIGQSSD